MSGIVRGTGLMLCTLALAFAAFAMTPERAAAEATPRAVEAAADELLRGLDAASLADVPAGDGYRTPTLAIRSVSEDDARAGEVRHANDVLLSALQQRASGRLRFVANDVVPDLIDEIGARAGSDAEHEARVRALQENLRADILVVGTVRTAGTGDVLVYKAIGMETGALLASAAPVSLDAPVFISARSGQDRLPADFPPSSFPQADTPSLDAPLPDAPTGYRQTVLEAERRLEQLGYAPGPVDGILTSDTRAALRAYQTDSALPVNGRMTWAVVENMRRDMR